MSTAVHRSNRIFVRTLAASLVLHLSAVTLFSIVFEFPRKDIEYFNVAIVETPALAAAPVPPNGEQISLAGPDFTGAAAASALPLPLIELPALRFEQMEKLRIRQEALETRSRFEEFFATDGELARATDSGLGTLAETLSRLTFGPADDRPAVPTPVSRPAPGFEAYIEWLEPPNDRKVLTVEPIDALWGVAPDSLPEPITLVFRVYRDGRVDKRVLSLRADTDDLVKSIAIELTQYRFEPLLGDGPETQSGTFIVRAGGEAP